MLVEVSPVPFQLLSELENLGAHVTGVLWWAMNILFMFTQVVKIFCLVLTFSTFVEAWSMTFPVGMKCFDRLVPCFTLHVDILTNTAVRELVLLQLGFVHKLLVTLVAVKLFFSMLFHHVFLEACSEVISFLQTQQWTC